jgi:hypothetical protein
MANLGDHFITGEIAPMAGIYRYVQSITDECLRVPESMDIPLSRGEPLPLHPDCTGAVTWELVEAVE